MEPLPLIPVLDVSQNAIAPLREALQDVIDGQTFPRDVARSIVQNEVNGELKLKDNAENALEISAELNENLKRIENAGRDIMDQQGRYMITKDEIEDITCLKERLRLKHCSLFKDLKAYLVDYFGLVQKKHLLPDLIKQFLDYKLNEGLHLCEKCMDDIKSGIDPIRRSEGVHEKVDEGSENGGKTFRVSKDTVEVQEIFRAKVKDNKKRKRRGTAKKIKHIPKKVVDKTVEKKQPIFIVLPDKVEFHNYITGQIYKRVVKIINASSTIQQLRISKLPDHSSFSLRLKSPSRIAPGIATTAVITFKPEIYLNFEDCAVFRNNDGDTVTLFLAVTRDNPRLIICILKPAKYTAAAVIPGTLKFVETRREALNYTIDCGSCLVGEYLMLMVFVQNKGMAGRFFIITEDEWFFQDIQNVSTSLELSVERFWLYPAYFELQTDDMTQLTILFYPNQPGLNIEKFYMICDNNSFEQVEVLGDAHEFTKDFIRIDVPPNDKRVNEIENYCIFLGTATCNSKYTITFTVYNDSPVFLNSLWKFRTRHDTRFVFFVGGTWEVPLDTQQVLPPHSVTDFNISVYVNAHVNGYHSVFFRFIITGVPMMSLNPGEVFVFAEREELTAKMLTKCVDIQILDMEVACCVCIVDIEEVATRELDTQGLMNEPPPRKLKLAFTSPFLDFGIIPAGLDVQKDVFVVNLNEECVKWRIVEVKYNIDSTPHMEILKEKHISRSSGKFCSQSQSEQIFYKIIGKDIGRWVSMLLLASIDDDTTINIEATCIVIYEIVNFDIAINTGHTKAPILCPLRLMYVGVPTRITFTVENNSPITGCFCFSKTYGADLEKIDIQISPRGGVLRPMESKEIAVQLTCSDVGIFENAFVSCFIGKNQEPIVLRVLCAVDGFHANFYLPAGPNNYRKIVWPPKVIYEYDDDWMICSCTKEHGQELELSYTNTLTSTKSYLDVKATPKIENNVSSERLQLKYGAENKSVEMVGEDILTEAVSEESKNSSPASSSYASLPKKDLMGILEDQFGADIFLQEYFTEMHQVPIRTPTQLTFYFENVTPMNTTYTVEATNFSTNRKFDERALTFKLKKLDEIWDDIIINDHGILVQPDIERGHVTDSELIRVNLIVYATTWGIYSEEIVVDIPDVPCFTFSLLVEVVGNPVQFPMALNSITPNPTVRFGKVSYCSGCIIRSMQIVNTACVPIYIFWHTFLTILGHEGHDPGFGVTFDIVDKKYFPDEARIVLMDKYYGHEPAGLFKIDPEDTIIDANSSRTIDVVLKPNLLPVELKSTEIKGFVVGHIFLEEQHRNKVNYFYRSTEADENPIKMEISAIFEMPLLTLDSMKEDNVLYVYANEIIFKKNWWNTIKLRFQNDNHSMSEGHMEVDEPFEIETINGRNTRGVNNYSVKGASCLEVSIVCKIDYQRILSLNQNMYGICQQGYVEELDSGYSLDEEYKIIHVRKHLRIFQNRAPIQRFPLDLHIYFPHIAVKPPQIKFDSVLIGETKKKLICVYNMTGCLVNFEIYKSLVTDEIFVTPHYGEIAKSTGIHKQFTNIFVYFTPRQCKLYQESIRIVTNIPNYYIEVLIKGTGLYNEKFHEDYKI